jgi:protein AaeX
MIGEIDVYGVFIPILLVWGVIALPITAVLRRGLSRIGFYRLVWHRPLVDLSLLVLVMAGVAAILPSWIAP